MELGLEAAYSSGDLLAITVAVAIGAFAKAVTGFGLPLVAVPVMAAALGPQRAVIVMALPTFVTNCWLLWEHRGYARQTRHLPAMLVLGLAGTAAGTVALTRTNPAWLALLLGTLVCVYVAGRVARPELRLRPGTVRRTAPAVGLAAGLVQGATGMSGPVVVTYVHAFGLPRRAFVFSVTAAFQSFALVQMVTFVLLGVYTAARVTESLLALVPALVVFPLGIRLADRIDPRRFEQFLLVLMAAMGLFLLVDGFTTL